jgi:hypothetical protein
MLHDFSHDGLGVLILEAVMTLQGNSLAAPLFFQAGFSAYSTKARR